MKNSGVLGHLEVRGNISYKNNNSGGPEELCPLIMCFSALFRQSLFNDKMKLKLKLIVFRFASFFSLSSIGVEGTSAFLLLIAMLAL